MQNFELLRACARTGKPVMIKRGLSATVEEWLLAAEYVAHSGNVDIILCERGIRTFEPSTRNTLDLSAVVVAQERSHLPVIVDPSHGTGGRTLVAPMALAAVAAGADGIMVDVHAAPAEPRAATGRRRSCPTRWSRSVPDSGSWRSGAAGAWTRTS